MSEQELARAFDDFVTTKAGGTGLGLSVVRRLVADLHGSLRVESAPGAGTTFTIELPAAPRRTSTEAARRSPAGQT
jgi:signal transduction histidine kinase